MFSPAKAGPLKLQANKAWKQVEAKS